MPELPDLEVFRRYFDSTALHQKIREVRILEDRLLEDIAPSRFRKRITEKSFESTHRHGKYLFAVLDDGSAVLLHFGMTGFLSYYKESTDESRHPRVIFDFDNGYHLAYDNQRMLGEVEIIEDAGDYLRRQGLGEDALDLTSSRFKSLVSGRRGSVKTTLMNQSFIAGIGNIYSDEILFQSGIHPKTKVQDLEENQIRTLFRQIQKVLTTAIDKKADPNEFPDDFLIPHRGEDDICPKCGGRIEKIKINNRGAYLCPKCQKK